MSPFATFRPFVSVFALWAFLYGQLAPGAERLQPGTLPPAKQDPANQTQQQPKQNPPAEGQQAPAEGPQPQTDQAKPPLPLGGETVVQVSVPKEDTLDITVLEGEGAANVIGKKITDRPLVKVTDNNKNPVDGATVTFIAPADGPSVVFADGLRTMTVMTDSQGRARAPAMHAVNAGQFKLQVSASYHGEMISTVISQTNYETKAEAANAPSPSSPNEPAAEKETPKTQGPIATKKGGLSGGVLAAIIGGGAAAAIGIALGAGHKGSSSSTGGSTTATIGTGGTPTVGAPH